MRHTNEITLSRSRTQGPRIDELEIGSAVRLDMGPNDRPQIVLFRGIEGTGDDRQAKFTSVSSHGDSYDWAAYRDNGRWAYGTSAQRLSLVEVLG